MPDDIMVVLTEAHRRVQKTNRALESFRQQTDRAPSTTTSSPQPLSSNLNVEIHKALAGISQPLCDSYAQVYLDLENREMVSWAGTVHQIREVLSGMLRILAPDDDVMGQPWYTKKTPSGMPSQRQRAKYILAKRGAGSQETELVEKHADFVDERVETLVRSTYDRASAAAHGTKDQTEVRRILRYFEAFTHDLLDLP